MVRVMLTRRALDPAGVTASLWGKAQEFFKDAKEQLDPQLPQLSNVQLYTFGAPRVGNSAFCAYFDAAFGDACFRVVNDRDVVPRLPRGAGAAGAVLDYEHVGRTVFIADRDEEADGFNGFWIEGTSDGATCPLRDVSPLSSPFSQGKVLGDVGGDVAKASEQVSSAWEKINAAAKVKSRSQLQVTPLLLTCDHVTTHRQLPRTIATHLCHPAPTHTQDACYDGAPSHLTVSPPT